MTISYPLAFPDYAAATALGMGPRSVVAAVPSPFSLAEELQVWDGMQWVIEIQVSPVLTRASAAKWLAFLASLNGKEGSFLFGDPLAASPLGAGGGTPVANSLGSPSVNLARDRRLFLRGFDGLVSNVLKAGDFFQIAAGSSSRLHMNLTDVSSDSSGEAIVDCWPALGSDIADGTAITLASPQGVFRMSTNEPRWNIQNGIEHGFTIPAYSVI